MKVDLIGVNALNHAETLQATFEKDANGDGALRVVDAAPFAYDLTTDSKKVKSVDRNVQEIAGHSGVQIRDTAAQNTIQIDVSKMSGRKNIMVLNGLNQAVGINLYVYTSASSGGITFTSQTVAAVTNKILTPTEYPILNEPIYKLLIQATCATAPTTGALTTWLYGVQS